MQQKTLNEKKNKLNHLKCQVDLWRAVQLNNPYLLKISLDGRKPYIDINEKMGNETLLDRAKSYKKNRVIPILVRYGAITSDEIRRIQRHNKNIDLQKGQTEIRYKTLN